MSARHSPGYVASLLVCVLSTTSCPAGDLTKPDRAYDWLAQRTCESLDSSDLCVSGGDLTDCFLVGCVNYNHQSILPRPELCDVSFHYVHVSEISRILSLDAAIWGTDSCWEFEFDAPPCPSFADPPEGVVATMTCYPR